MASSSSASGSGGNGGAAGSPLANIITQVPQSGPAFSSAAARPVKVKKKKQDSVSAPAGAAGAAAAAATAAGTAAAAGPSSTAGAGAGTTAATGESTASTSTAAAGAATATSAAVTPKKPSRKTSTTIATTPAAASSTAPQPADAATTPARTAPLSPAEVAAQAAANTQAQQQLQQTLAPPRTTSKRKPSGASATTASARNASGTTSATAATSGAGAAAPAAPAGSAASIASGTTTASAAAAAATPHPPTSRSQAFTTTAPKEKVGSSASSAKHLPPPSPTTAKAASKTPASQFAVPPTSGTAASKTAARTTAASAATAAAKPKFFRRFIAILTCSSPSHVASPSDDSARTLTDPSGSAGKKSYEAATASTIDKSNAASLSSAGKIAHKDEKAGAKDIDEKAASATGAGLKPVSAAPQAPSTPVKQATGNTLTIPNANGRITPSSSSSSAMATAAAAAAAAAAGGAGAPPSPSPSTIAGGTRLPREETGDVTSGAVVPPGASYVPTAHAGAAVNMVRRASAVDGVPSLVTIAAAGEVAGLGMSNSTSHVLAGTDGEGEHGLLLPHHPHAATPHAPAHGHEDEDDMETDDDDEEEDDEEGEESELLGRESGHLDEEEYELSEEALEEQRLIAQGGMGIPLDEHGNPHPLLAPIGGKDEGRKCLVLDLDETLVHSSFKMIQNADFIVPVEIEGHFHNVYVIKRPGVDEFMRKMGEIYEVVVFTASLSKYADPVLDMLDIHRVVRHRLFRESCYNHKGNYVKDLSQLGRPIGETLILDNSPASYIFHANNAVPVSSWFNDPHDTELVDLCEFLRDLSVVDDVRTVLDGAL
ncbi:hypothetical protein OC842_004292 [Tilletia horrida]|uniref:FCP1 homology domain-containing protein n=1 Tax=Tilletia horrida TaxID=155126 RepID=A0AAN6GCC8_9BASI|nr:hypothetical protein OC842_004292 [Tilletia horrida]